MTERKEIKNEMPPDPNGEVCRDLICAEEWKDPAGRKVLTEFHKEGLPKELVGVDADLESFERYWMKKGGSIKVKSEYHKNGAPFLDRDHVLGGIGIRVESSAATSEPQLLEQVETGEEPREQVRANPGTPPEDPRSPAPGDAAPKGRIQRTIDLGMVEMVSYALFRIAFNKGVNIPIKREGMVDLDVTVKGKEIIINSNQLFFSVPELNVWHIVYQHKGKPILELGRGVKNGMVIHRLQAIRLGLEMWNGSRKMNKLKLQQLKGADKNLPARPADE